MQEHRKEPVMSVNVNLHLYVRAAANSREVIRADGKPPGDVLDNIECTYPEDLKMKVNDGAEIYSCNACLRWIE